jgi:hypothetical protein
MKALSAKLLATVDAADARLQAIGEANAAEPALAGGWSRKQLLGHLIDSASNNHQRFVRAALSDALAFPAYDTDGWAGLENAQEAAWGTLVALWANYNRYLAHVVSHLPADKLVSFRQGCVRAEILGNVSRFGGCGSVRGRGGCFGQLAGAELLLEYLVYLGGRECFRIVRTSPPEHVLMFFVFGVGQHYQVFFISGSSTHIFWGRAAFAADARRIWRGRLRQQDGLQHQIMLPTVTEVI